MLLPSLRNKNIFYQSFFIIAASLFANRVSAQSWAEGVWGEGTWGQMIWGTYTIPAVPVIGLLLLGAALVFITNRYGAKKIAPLLFVLLIPFAAIGVPNIFQNGTIADAEEVNANFSSVESLHNRFAISRDFPLYILSGNSSYQDLPSRNLSFDKQFGTSSLLVTYADTFASNAQNTNARTCEYRLLLDGSAVGKLKYVTAGESIIDISTSLQWWIENVPAGPHLIQIQGNAGAFSAHCWVGGGKGWINGQIITSVDPENFLLVEEKGI